MTANRDVSVPTDAVAFGCWLKAAFGANGLSAITWSRAPMASITSGARV